MKFRPIKVPSYAAVLEQAEGSYAENGAAEGTIQHGPVSESPRTEISDGSGLGADSCLRLLNPETAEKEARSQQTLPARRLAQKPSQTNKPAAKGARPFLGANQPPPPARRAKPGTLPMCPQCRQTRLNVSTVKGLKEEVLFIFGASFYRCFRCEARFTRVGRHFLHLKEAKEIKKEHLVFAAITIGSLLCIGVALYVQRMAHRWPF